MHHRQGGGAASAKRPTILQSLGTRSSGRARKSESRSIIHLIAYYSTQSHTMTPYMRSNGEIVNSRSAAATTSRVHSNIHSRARAFSMSSSPFTMTVSHALEMT